MSTSPLALAHMPVTRKGQFHKITVYSGVLAAEDLIDSSGLGVAEAKLGLK